MTEVLPTCNNDIMSLILHPESILFANPVAQAACIADSVSSAANRPLDALFWCMGSWGSSYPLSGSIVATDYVQAQAGIAARMIYLMGRSGLLLNANYDGCSFQYASIWQKSNYRLQLMQPVKGNHCLNIGKSGLLWSGFKNPIGSGDNFSFMMFRKVKCCATYNSQ
jgi:conjugal transfer pilus assembly protein TraU